MKVERIVARRKQLKLSQIALSDGICTQATLSKLENGLQIPSIDILVSLCEKLGLTLNDIFPMHTKQALTNDEVYLNQAIQAQIHQNVTKYRMIFKKIELKSLREEKRAVYHLSHYLAALFFDNDVVSARRWRDRINTNELVDDQQLLLMAGEAYQCYMVGHSDRAQNLFAKIWQQQNFSARSVQENASVANIVTLYLSARFELACGRYKNTVFLASYGINLLSDTDHSYFLENFFLLMVQADKQLQGQRFVHNEMLKNARTLAKLHQNELILQQIGTLF